MFIPLENADGGTSRQPPLVRPGQRAGLLSRWQSVEGAYDCEDRSSPYRQLVPKPCCNSPGTSCYQLVLKCANHCIPCHQLGLELHHQATRAQNHAVNFSAVVCDVQNNNNVVSSYSSAVQNNSNVESSYSSAVQNISNVVSSLSFSEVSAVQNNNNNNVTSWLVRVREGCHLGYHWALGTAAP